MTKTKSHKINFVTQKGEAVLDLDVLLDFEFFLLFLHVVLLVVPPELTFLGLTAENGTSLSLSAMRPNTKQRSKRIQSRGGTE